MIADDGTLEKNSTKHLPLDSPNSKPSCQSAVVAARNALVHGSSPSFACLLWSDYNSHLPGSLIFTALSILQRKGNQGDHLYRKALTA
jgi:hypothetical protein